MIQVRINLSCLDPSCHRVMEKRGCWLNKDFQVCYSGLHPESTPALATDGRATCDVNVHGIVLKSKCDVSVDEDTYTLFFGDEHDPFFYINGKEGVYTASWNGP